MIQKDSEETRKLAAKTVKRGGVIAFRTDTFYGLGADPHNRDAVARIRDLKGREEAKPILLLISDFSEADRFITKQSDLFTDLAKRFWPGPLTLIGAAHPELASQLTAGTGTIGVRLPENGNVRALVRACGGTLTATSANVSGQPAARTAAEVENYFSNGIDLIIDGGKVTATQPSTVLDLTQSEARLVREGAILREVLGLFDAK